LQKPKLVYLIDHIYDDLALEQVCHVHNKDWLSEYFNILFIVRTLNPTFVKKRAGFSIKAFNRNIPYEEIRGEIERFSPDIIQLFGPLFLGEARRFVQDFHGRCKIIQRYAGAYPDGYGGDFVDYLVIDDVHAPAFQHIPPEKRVVARICSDLNIYRPLPEVEKVYDGIQVGGFYCRKGQDILVRTFAKEPVRLLFIGAQKSNEGIYTDEYLYTKQLYEQTKDKLSVDFVDFVHPTELPLIYNKAKIFLWGAHESYENPITLTNRSVAEAVACGLPIVGFNKTFQKSNFVLDGENAFLVDSENEFKLVVLFLLNNEKIRQKMANRSREIAMEMLDFQKWHNEFFFNLYKRILDAPK
jgi:glycosyltransferase involved in cell wall biosynthesis